MNPATEIRDTTSNSRASGEEEEDEKRNSEMEIVIIMNCFLFWFFQRSFSFSASFLQTVVAARNVAGGSAEDDFVLEFHDLAAKPHGHRR